MRPVKQILYKIFTTSPQKLLRTVGYKVVSSAKENVQKWHDKYYSTYEDRFSAEAVCKPLFDDFVFDCAAIDEHKVKVLGEMYMKHRFDLLGTGWVKCGYIDNAPGFNGCRYEALELKADSKGDFLEKVINKSNLSKAKEIWRGVSKDYVPIDWQKDYKSGYRWSARHWYRPQRNAHLPGGDIKVPWELSRLQHLPRLAFLAEMFPEKEACFWREFVNEILDFAAANPPRMGVNYMCTMDIGIRTANIALAYTLFRIKGFRFTGPENRVFANFLYSQCKHIKNNLEWSAVLTSNHYFADIAGLLFGCAVLPDCSEKKTWIGFAADEIQKEIRKQFHAEGTNAEGSTAYHRLTSEMAVYSLALMQNLAKQGYCRQPDKDLFSLIAKAGVFLSDITKPDGSFTQIGDNDSGLFFRLSITGEVLSAEEAKAKYVNLQSYQPEEENELYLDENMNDGRTFCSAVYGLTSVSSLQRYALQYPLEAALIQAIAGEKVAVDDIVHEPINTMGASDENLSFCKEKEIDFPKVLLTDGLYQLVYPEFGIYLYKSKSLYICINATDNGQKGNAGHAHNDKLSIELVVAGKNYYIDPGTYVYTAAPDMRNEFRSVNAHNCIQTGMEQNEYLSLFSMVDSTRCHCIQWDGRKACFEVRYKNVIHRREIIISDYRITIKDYCNVPFTVRWENRPVTAGYGKLLNDRNEDGI